MIPGLEEIDSVIQDAVDQPVLLGDTARPDAWAQMLQRLWLAKPTERLAHGGLNELQYPKGYLAIDADPVPQVFTENWVEGS